MAAPLYQINKFLTITS